MNCSFTPKHVNFPQTFLCITWYVALIPRVSTYRFSYLNLSRNGKANFFHCLAESFIVPLLLWGRWRFVDYEKEPKMFPFLFSFLSFAVLISDCIFCFLWNKGCNSVHLKSTVITFKRFICICTGSNFAVLSLHSMVNGFYGEELYNWRLCLQAYIKKFVEPQVRLH